MKYTGNVCPGCNEAFNDGDDVVVCPECGTPQHRECFEKENKCVCSHLHGEAYSWQGVTKKEAPLLKEKKETIPCPNCGYGNEVGTTVCKQCGMKFTLFGMNVVDVMHKQEAKTKGNTNRDIPDYEAPFTLGEDEAFSNTEKESRMAAAEKIEGLLTDILTGKAEEKAEPDGRLNFGGPFPLSDEIGGVRINTIGNFIGTNAMGYISKFKKLQSGKAFSFNFAAFFFAPYWFFFRKLYKVGIVAMTVLLGLSIVVTPYLYEMLEVYEEFATVVQSGTVTDEAAFQELYNMFFSASLPMAIYFFATVFVHLICGFIANPLYKKYVILHAGKAERMGSINEAMAYVVKNGGASMLIAFASYFAQQLILSLVSTML